MRVCLRYTMYMISNSGNMKMYDYFGGELTNTYRALAPEAVLLTRDVVLLPLSKLISRHAVIFNQLAHKVRRTLKNRLAWLTECHFRKRLVTC